MSIAGNIEFLKKHIAMAAMKAGKHPESIQVIAVTKTVDIAMIEQAIKAGITEIGENRVQEAKKKYAVIHDRVTWHMIGHLQTNKVKDAVGIFNLIHSLDSIKLAQEIEKRTSSRIDCLIEVNTSHELTKHGIDPEAGISFYESLQRYKKINVKGLMTIGPGWAIEEKEASRPCFRKLVALRDSIEKRFQCALPILSMGMTSDYEVAIEEGANMIRVGTAIFGPRK
jgi:pyridoxal phosphate enzyme (YggS family)